MLIEPLDTTDVALEKLDPFDGVAAYSRTKRHQVALTEKFADVYADTPVSFYSMHPGWVSPHPPSIIQLTFVEVGYARICNSIARILQNMEEFD